MLSIIAAILILSFLIIVHEIGHFAAAKLLGVKVIEFSLFMGPRLLSFQKGETRYSLKLIPVGGSCLMEGESATSDDDRALNHKPRWVRAAIFSAGSFMNLVIAFILVLIMSVYNGGASCEIGAVADFSPAAAGAEPLAAGDILVSYAGKRVHVPVEVFIYIQDTKGAPAEVGFMRDGVLKKTVITPEFTPAKRYQLGFQSAQTYGPDWNLIQAVGADEPAGALGMESGDRLLSVSGKEPANREALRALLAEADGGEVDVSWLKADGTIAAGRVAPKLVNDQDYYDHGMRFLWINRFGLPGSIRHAFYSSVSYCKMVIYSLKWMITGAIGINQFSGPVGIVAEIGAGVEETSKSPNGPGVMISFIMELSALIGINLGLFNLIPFPPLDGSKLLILGVETIRRKDISPERQMIISMFGFAVLILVMIFTLFNDITRIVAK
jgi:regulator of sigma E protease